VLSALYSTTVAWSMASLEAPRVLVAVWVGFACVKLAACGAYAYQLRYSTSGLLALFVVFAALDLSFLFYHPWNSLLLVPSNGLALFSGLVLLLSIAEATGRALRHGGRHAA
jgi:hypothetical protein